MPQKKKPSKKTIVAATRREYDKLTRAYHKIGEKALGKPKKSQVQQDYQAVKRERNRVGRRLGLLTGAHRGR